MSVTATRETGSPAFVDLGEVLLRVAGSAGAIARGRGVRVLVEVENGPLVVPGPAGALYDAVLEAVGQSVTTCAPGSQIVLDVHREDGGVVVSITENDQDARAARVDTARVAAAVQALGGRLSTTSVDFVGTVVSLWWPVVAPAVPTRHLSLV